MVDPGGEAEVVIHSPGEGQLALLTVGNHTPILITLDQPVKSVVISTPQCPADEVEIEVSRYSDGRLHGGFYRLHLRQPRFSGLVNHRMSVEQVQGGLVLSADPPGLEGRSLVLDGPILWPPLPVEIDRPSTIKAIGPTPGYLASGTMVRRREEPPAQAREACQREAAGKTDPPQAPQPPQVHTVIPAMVAPLEPARLLAEHGIGTYGKKGPVSVQTDTLPTAVVVLPGNEVSPPTFLVVHQPKPSR